MSTQPSDSPPPDRPGRRRLLACLAAGASCVVGGAGGAAAVYPWRSRETAGSGESSPEPPRAPPGVEPAAVPALDHEHYMRAAIAQARLVPELPFGAVLVDVRSGEIMGEGHNRSQQNPTFHGEIDAINRLAARSNNVDWSTLAMYTTAEPCPMCQSAIEWAGIACVVYGSSIPFLQRLGWWQIDVRAAAVIERTRFRKTAILGGVLEEECNDLFLAVPKGMHRDADEKSG